VIEADEYDTASSTSARSSSGTWPRTAVLGQPEYDHADIFPDLGAIETQFHISCRIVPSQGLLVVNGEQAALERVLARGSWTPVERFRRRARSGAWARSTPTTPSTCCWTAHARGTVRFSLMGEHNRQNALAALAAARHAGVPVAKARSSRSRASRA
jgi:UDP-N-acetylmuramate: L-alanyl-gamma-D-glutamyl-meso-diaminopimelate ligase